MWRRQVLPRYPHSSAGAYGQATEQCKPRKCRADYYGRPSAIFRVKRSQVRSFLTSVWQNVRTKQAPCHAPILTSACALLTTPILPRGRKIVRLTMTCCEAAESDASGLSKKPKRRQVSLSMFTKWQAQLEWEHQTMTWLCCDMDKSDPLSRYAVLPRVQNKWS